MPFKSMSRYRRVIVSLLLGCGSVSALGADDFSKLSIQKDIKPLLEQYCFECHGPKEMEGGFDFSTYNDFESILADRQTWEMAIEQLEQGFMPPKKAKRKLPDADRAKLIGWARFAIHNIDCEKLKNPGHGAIRRLNRAEYSNTVRDLIGLDLDPAQAFPGDEAAYGFDVIGDVLSLPPVLLEKYYDAAENIMDHAMVPQSYTWQFEAEKLDFVVQKRATGGEASKPADAKDKDKPDSTQDDAQRNPIVDGMRSMMDEGDVTTLVSVPEDGFYTIKVYAAGQQAGRGSVRMGIFVDGEQIKADNVTAKPGAPRPMMARLKLKRGQHFLAAGFLNSFYDPKQPDPTKRDRRLMIDRLEVEGPSAAKETPEALAAHKRIFIAQPGPGVSEKQAAGKIFEAFAARAFRRPVDQASMDRIHRLYDQARSDGESYHGAVRMGLEYILVSPRFLYRVERNAAGAQSGEAFAVDDYDLASRLSYFLWSSMPDQELFDLASKKKLGEPATLEAQVRRMLKDERSAALAVRFASQWLGLNQFEDIKPDKETFPQFTPELREAMRQEFLEVFSRIVREDRSILELIDADYTYLNETLAKHYNIDGVRGDVMKPVKLKDRRRGGVLGMGAFLTLTANPTRTNIPRRGKWILESVLGTPPPPPPPAVPPLEEDTKAKPSKQTLRQKLEEHRRDPTCGGCHAKIDSMGFALESFDAIGRWRTQDEFGRTIDAVGELASGKTIEGPEGLKRAVMARKNQFAKNMARQMLTYALGRGLEYFDVCAIDEAAVALEHHEYRFSELVSAIVKSYPFRHRRKD